MQRTREADTVKPWRTSACALEDRGYRVDTVYLVPDESAHGSADEGAAISCPEFETDISYGSGNAPQRHSLPPLLRAARPVLESDIRYNCTIKMAKKPKSTKQKLLTPTEVADMLLIAPVTVRLWASRGLLPSVATPGGHRRFRPEDVQTFINLQRQTNSASAAGPSRVLIIDDDEQFSRYLTALLRKQVDGSIEIETAIDGFMAGMKMESMRPDLVTLDLQMPGMDGFEVCRLLRSMPKRARLRIVVLTGFPTADNVAMALAAGADACLGKTVPTKQLLRELGFAPK